MCMWTHVFVVHMCMWYTCVCGVYVYVPLLCVWYACVCGVHVCGTRVCVCGAHVCVMRMCMQCSCVWYVCLCGVHALVWICMWSNTKGWHWVLPSISLHLTYWWFRFSHLNLELALWCCLMSQFASVFLSLSSKSWNYTWAGKSTKHFGILNSSPYDCMANTLPSRSLPLSQGKLTLKILPSRPKGKKLLL